MGRFDTVHTGFRHGQTKAFGKGGAAWVVGDLVACYPAPISNEEYDAWLAGADIKPHPDTSFQIATLEGGYLTVRDGTLRGWEDTRDASLSLFSNLGQPISDAGIDETQTLGQPTGTSEWVDKALDAPANCPLCGAVRRGEAGEYRAAQKAARSELREAAQARRANRPRRGHLRPAGEPEPVLVDGPLEDWERALLAPRSSTSGREDQAP